MSTDDANYTNRQRLTITTTHPPVNKTDDGGVSDIPIPLVSRQLGDVLPLIHPLEGSCVDLHHVFVETREQKAGVRSKTLLSRTLFLHEISHLPDIETAPFLSHELSHSVYSTYNSTPAPARHELHWLKAR